MTEFQSQLPRIALLADRLTEDIRERDLQPGDPYLTTLDASKMLGVGNGIANRALQLLEKRSVIVRRRRKGAFIACQSRTPHSVPPLQNVHLLVHQHYFEMEGVANDGVLIGMQGELPGSSVSISFLPVQEETQFIDNLIQRSLQSNQRDGFVLIRASFQTQQHLAASALPCVVYGCVYPSIERLPSVMRDNTSIGRYLAQHLLKQGNRRIVYLTRQNVLPGDYKAMDAILDTMFQAGLTLKDFVMRSMPLEENSTEAMAASLHAESSVPTGFICRNPRLADGVSRTVEAKYGKNQVHSHITVCDYYLKVGEKPRYIYPKPVLSPEEQGQHLGRILACLARGERPDPFFEITPVEVKYPEG